MFAARAALRTRFPRPTQLRWAHTRPEVPSLSREGSVGKHPFDIGSENPPHVGGSGEGGGGGGSGRGDAGSSGGEKKDKKMRDALADPMTGPSGRVRDSAAPPPPPPPPPPSQSQEPAPGPGPSQSSSPPSPGAGTPQDTKEPRPDMPMLPTHTLPPRPPPPHPFDTFKFVSSLSGAGVAPESARTLMKAVRAMVSQRTQVAQDRMLSQEEMDNDAYRFKAALSDIRTGHSVRSRRDSVALRAVASAIRREVDSLERQIKEDIGTLRHDVEIDLNNRKAETRSDMKMFDIAREEINNKFTISLGDLRTEIEGAKWDATRRAIAIIITLVIIGVALSTVGAKPAVPPKPAMVDVAVGTEDELTEEQLRAGAEAELDRLLGERRRQEKQGVKETERI